MKRILILTVVMMSCHVAKSEDIAVICAQYGIPDCGNPNIANASQAERDAILALANQTQSDLAQLNQQQQAQENLLIANLVAQQQQEQRDRQLQAQFIAAVIQQQQQYAQQQQQQVALQAILSQQLGLPFGAYQGQLSPGLLPAQFGYGVSLSQLLGANGQD